MSDAMIATAWQRERVRTALAGGRLGDPIEFHEAVDSTNDVVWERARDGAAEGTTVVAERQTRGRGREGRAWHSPPGVGVWVSFLLRPRFPLARAGLLPVVTGVACARAAESVGAPVGLKWPNDIVAPGGEKIGGLLAESRSDGSTSWAVANGIGVNVNTEREQFPEALRDRALSLRLLAGRPVSREEFLIRLTAFLTESYESLESGRSGALLDEWRARAAHLGRFVRLREGSRVLEGTARDIAEDGALVVRLDSGAERLVRVGDLEVTWETGSESRER